MAALWVILAALGASYHFIPENIEGGYERAIVFVGLVCTIEVALVLLGYGTERDEYHPTAQPEAMD